MTDKPISIISSEQKTETPLVEKELNTIRSVVNKVETYGPTLQKAYEGGKKDLYQIAIDAGYTLQEVELGTSFINFYHNPDTIKEKNSVRIGEGKKLLVGYDKDRTINLIDLAHDVGVIMTGVEVPDDQVNTIRLIFFEDKLGLDFEELKEAGLIALNKKGEFVIPSSAIFDAIVLHKSFPIEKIKKNL